MKREQMIKNILIALSVVMNGALLMYMVGVLPFLLFLSSLIILALSWYIRELIRKMQTIDDDIGQLFDDIGEFQSHLLAINELEMFYGDETLQSLLGHSRSLVDQFQEFQFKYTSDDAFGDYIIEEEIEYDDTDETETSPQEEII